MRLKDTDYLYATMRVRANEKNLLTPQKTERMIDAKTPDEAAKILAESGYGDISARSFSDIERALTKQRDETMALIAEVCKNTYIAEVFALKYDFHNIKAVIKAQLTGQNPERLLSGSGTIPSAELLRTFSTDEMSVLPEKMAQAAKLALETLSHTGDPQLSDFVLDCACFEMMSDAAKASGSEFLQGYVSLLADTSNLRSMVRVSRQGRDSDVLRSCLVSGGNISEDVFMRYDFEHGFSGTPLETAAAFGQDAAKGIKGMLGFERELDNALIRYMKSAKYVAFDERPIIAYIAAKEAEVMTVRIIMAGKLENISPDEIRSRLRVL